MPPEDDDFVAELLERARLAHEAAAQQRARAEILTAFVGRFRENRDELPLRCAWCGRVEIDGRFVAPEEFLSGDLPERLRERSSHGICPECFERTSREADETRDAGAT